MTMMTSSAMASHSSKSVVWYAKNKHYTGGPHNMCDVLDKVENRGIAKGKAEGEDTLALLMNDRLSEKCYRITYGGFWIWRKKKYTTVLLTGGK